MDRQTFSTLCEYFNMVHGITVRAIDAFTDQELDFRPKPDMRTPRELIFHVYSQQKILADAAHLGQFTAEAASRSSPEEQAAAAEVQALATVDDLRAYAQACHQTAQNIHSGICRLPEGGLCKSYTALPVRSSNIRKSFPTPTVTGRTIAPSVKPNVL